MLKSVWDRLKKNLNNREEKSMGRKKTGAVPVAQPSEKKKNDHRHERGQQEKGLYSTGVHATAGI